MKITNHSRSPLGIPGHGMIAPGQSMPDVSESIKDNTVVAAWFKAGILAEVSEPAADDMKPPEPADNGNDEKDDLIAALADKGIHKTRRSSITRLREALDEAQ